MTQNKETEKIQTMEETARSAQIAHVLFLDIVGYSPQIVALPVLSESAQRRNPEIWSAR